MKALACALLVHMVNRLSEVMKTWSVTLLESDTTWDHVLGVCCLQALLGTMVLGWVP